MIVTITTLKAFSYVEKNNDGNEIKMRTTWLKKLSVNDLLEQLKNNQLKSL